MSEEIIIESSGKLIFKSGNKTFKFKILNTKDTFNSLMISMERIEDEESRSC